MSINEKIEDKIKELQQELQNQNAYLANINEALRKLRADRKTVQARVQEIIGSVNAFNAVIEATKAETPKAIEGELVKE